MTVIPTSTEPAVSIAVNGHAVSETSTTGLTRTHTYNALGWRTASTDPRTGTTEYTYDTVGRLTQIEDPAENRTAFGYDAHGRRNLVTDALNQATHTEYDVLGRVIATWGATYPVAYQYDDDGRMTAMATTRDPAHESINLLTLLPSGLALSDVSDPSYPSALDTTRWLYDGATGLLTAKVYSDGKGPTYTYTADGRLATRMWAREIEVENVMVPVATTYAYADSGELLSVAYNDDTPGVTYTYDRLGRQETVTDALGLRTFVYDPDTLALVEEQLPGDVTLLRGHDDFGRPESIAIDGAGYLVEYAYTAQGRFGSVEASIGSTQSTATYSYTPDSDLVSGYTLGNLTRTVTYEPQRNMVNVVENAYGQTSISKFDYTNDAIGRRTGREDSGSAFASTQGNVFGYNLRSEVESATMRNGQSNYTHDPIGNRIEVTLPEEPNPIAYTANVLNQYAAITGRTNPAHDDDGNMLDDGAGLAMAWDGENRLIKTVGDTMTVTYAYDYMSRRAQKTVFDNADLGSPISDHRYLYDGWLLVREQSASGGNISTSHYVWGLDLSQSLQGAGGVGGLLMVSGPDGLFAPTYDANGNISEYIHLATGAIAAHLEYDAFGRTIATTGTAPAPIGFSTKYTDDETGLVYYGYRYYSPELGRWLNRDPITDKVFFNQYFESANTIERIGILGQYYAGNAYLFVQNHPVDATDSLGLREETTTGAWYNYAGLGGVIRHHGDDQNLPPSDPSRKPNFNYIHYKLQCKKCEKATPQPSPPSWAPAPQSQVIDYDSGDCDGKAGFADLSIQTRTLLWLALSHHALALDLAGEAALQELAGKQFKYECTPCTSGK